MTSPDGSKPSGAYGPGSDLGSSATVASAQAAMTSIPAISAWEGAQAAWKGRRGVDDASLSDLWGRAGGIDSNLKLLADIDGFASSFMGKNWTVGASTTVRVPFEKVLGAVKKADVDATNGRLILKAGGLWRVDAQVAFSGYTTNQTIYPISTPPYFRVETSYDPIAPRLTLEVHNPAGVLLTARRCDALPNVAIYGSSSFETLNYPATVAFNHTFVLEDMAGSTDWAYVSLLFRYEPIATGTVASANCTLSGGTSKSALVAARWSRDPVNNAYVPTAPDGGRIG